MDGKAFDRAMGNMVRNLIFFALVVPFMSFALGGLLVVAIKHYYPPPCEKCAKEIKDK